MIVYVLIALLSAIIAFVPSKIIIFIINVFVSTKNTIKITKNNQYHTITAKYVPHRNDITTPNKDGNYTYVYEYEVNGHKKYHLVNSPLSPDDEIKMYYLNNPEYAKPSLTFLSWKEIGISKKTKRVIFGIVTIAIFITLIIGWKLRY